MPSDLIYREDAKDYARHAIANGLNVIEYLDECPLCGSIGALSWIDGEEEEAEGE